MRSTLLAAACLAALTLTGCPNPNAIGVQKFGTIAATVVLASNNTPVPNAEVIVNTTQNGQCTTHADGTCQVTQVPVGPQVVQAAATGLTGPPVSVNVAQENQIYPVTVLMYPSS
ncbi:MAG: carboxypeptidase regulatory-like domain-containing protein [Candidatus Eremiobacteraeota bacterium]|nr:carboxypeptidase regulatory-like domain-containing protein [Candidatus Eremiobacteraeota bacterium]